MTFPASNGSAPLLASGQHSQIRVGLILSSVLAIALGLMTLIWPGITLLLVAIFFGVSLVFMGIARITSAFNGKFLPTAIRVLEGILGVLILVAGWLVILSPGSGLAILAIYVGIGWILEGVVTLIHGIMWPTIAPRWLVIVGGVLSIAAGGVVLALPGQSLAVFAIWAGVLLVAIGVVQLFNLPKKAPAAS